MKRSKTKEGIYLELDCLLDTRIATIARIDQKSAIQVLKNNYHIRQKDDFPNVDMQVYQDLYNKRDVETLQASAPTNFTSILNDLIRKLLSKTINEPYFEDVKIIVNTYPYALNKEEMKGIQNAIKQWTSHRIDVDVVYIRPDNLTPSYVKNHFAMLVMYDYNSWLNKHHEGFKHVLLHDVILFGPAIYFNTMPTQTEFEEMRNQNTHPFQAMEMLAAPIIGLQLIDVKYFSVLQPK